MNHYAMKKNFVSLLLAATLIGLVSSHGQTSDPNQEARLLALIKEVQTQQVQMAENQKQIETKLADISETVRVARIYSGRSQ